MKMLRDVELYTVCPLLNNGPISENAQQNNLGVHSLHNATKTGKSNHTHVNALLNHKRY